MQIVPRPIKGRSPSRGVVGCFGICACRLQCNGCKIVVTFCCHVRREMWVSHVMLHDFCMGAVLGRKLERETLGFSVCLVCATGAAAVVHSGRKPVPPLCSAT